MYPHCIHHWQLNFRDCFANQHCLSLETAEITSGKPQKKQKKSNKNCDRLTVFARIAPHFSIPTSSLYPCNFEV